MARDKQRLKLQYAGMTSSPDDYLSPDGELLSCFGLDDEAGAKISARRHGPKEVCKTSYMDEGRPCTLSLQYIHKMEMKKVAIFERERAGDHGNSYVWIDITNGWPDVINDDSIDGGIGIGRHRIKAFKSIGNTLICSDDWSLYYLVFKTQSETESGYKYLGTRLPIPNITFGLQSKFQHYFDGTVFPSNAEDDTDVSETAEEDFFYIDEKVTVSSSQTEDYFTIKSENVAYATETIMAKVNKCMYEGTEKGWFMQPFLVRYVLDLYDGSTSMASAPVYMPVCAPSNRGVSPMAVYDGSGGKKGDLYPWHIDVMRSALDYAIEESSLEELKEWGDIVKGISIAVTSPIYTYYPGQKVDAVYTTFVNKGFREIKTISKDLGLDDQTYKFDDCANFTSGENIYTSPDGYTHSINEIARPALCFRLGYKSKSDYDEYLKSRSVFYLLKKIKTEDLKTERTIVKVSKGFLNTLETQLTVKDSYNAQENLSAGYMYVYNGRLNLAKITRNLWKSFDPSILWAYQNENTLLGEVELTFEIEEGGKTYQIKSDKKVTRGYLHAAGYVFYPNTNVKNVWATENFNGQYYAWKLQMQEHTGLNGSVGVGDINQVLVYSYDTEGADPAPSMTESSIQTYNKLYTSNARNPFVFESTNINTIGNGRILGMAVAAKAISIGQAGVFPMYCMTEDGVWIMRVNDTGGWASQQAIMSDACTVSEAIIETDGAVIMPTKRGLMLLQGEQSVCITDSNRKCSNITVTDLPKLHEALRDKWMSNLGDDAIPDIDEYMDSENLRGIYDYKNQRVIYYRQDKPYCVVLSMGERPLIYCQEWNINGAVKDIDDCYMMMSSGEELYLTKLNGVEKEGSELDITRDALIITRPVKGTEIGLRDMRKQLDTIWHQGRYRKGTFDILLYGTTDYENWHLIGQAKSATGLYGHHGQHWMAFIAVVYIHNMQEKDHIDCIDLTITGRLSGKSPAMTGY